MTEIEKLKEELKTYAATIGDIYLINLKYKESNKLSVNPQSAVKEIDDLVQKLARNLDSIRRNNNGKY